MHILKATGVCDATEPKLHLSPTKFSQNIEPTPELVRPFYSGNRCFLDISRCFSIPCFRPSRFVARGLVAILGIITPFRPFISVDT